MKKKRILIIVTALLLCAVLLLPASAEAMYEMVFSPTYGQTEARQMLSSINELRQPGNAWYWNESDSAKITPTNLQALVYDYTLEKIAMQRAAEIAISFSHTRPDGSRCFTAFTDLGYSAWARGENIAAGYPTAASVFEGWCETDDPYEGQGHRRNMLSENFTGVGIGHVVVNGYHYWVQEFGRPQGSDDTTVTPAAQTTVRFDADLHNVGALTLSADTLSVKKGASVTLPTVTGTVNGKTVTPAGVTVSSSNPSVVTVGNGKATGVAAGSATLTYSAFGKTATVSVTVTSDEQAPAVPQSVKAAAGGEKAITVSWNAVSGATQYNVYRYRGSDKQYHYVGTAFATAAKPTQYVNTGLTVGTTYYYKVVAVKKTAGQTLISGYSAAANAKALGTPAVPQSVTAKAGGEKAITISWAAVKNATQYNVYRYRGSDKQYHYVGTTFATAAKPTQYMDKNLYAGTTYYYKVVTVTKGSGLTFVSAQSAAANAKAVAAPAVPTGVTVKATGDKQLTVFWAVVTGATQYNIYRYNGTKKEYVYKGTTFATAEKPTQFVDATVVAGTTYYYKVVAVKKTADYTLVSDKSAAANAKALTAPPVPQNVTAVATGSNMIVLYWAESDGSTQYNIYRSNSATGTFKYIGTSYSTNYVNQNLMAGTTYYYKVVAVNKTADYTLVSEQSAAASAKAK